MSSNPILWWAYDSENGSFATLPAGPLLLPAIGILAFVAIANALKGHSDSPEKIIGRSVVSSNRYKADKNRHDYLLNKKIEAAINDEPGLSPAEITELHRLQHPSYTKGQKWTY